MIKSQCLLCGGRNQTKHINNEVRLRPTAVMVMCQYCGEGMAHAETEADTTQQEKGLAPATQHGEGRPID